MSSSYIEVELNHQPVELCKLLKIANLVGGGGEAKIVISEGYVLVNGEVEYQKRKKIYHEDVVEFNGETVQLIINDELEIPEVVETDEPKRQPINEASDKQPQARASRNKAAKGQQKNKHRDSKNKRPEQANVETSMPTEPKKRRPISF